MKPVLVLICVVSIVFSMLFLAWGGVRIVKQIQFKINCTGHLKRAADANTIDLAKQELRIAVNYLEDNNITSGYTSVLYNTPDEDVGFWYKTSRSLTRCLLTPASLRKQMY